MSIILPETVPLQFIQACRLTEYVTLRRVILLLDTRPFTDFRRGGWGHGWAGGRLRDMLDCAMNVTLNKKMNLTNF